MSKVQINKEKFIKQVNEERLNAKELAIIYDLPEYQIRKALKALGLRTKRKFEDKFEFIEQETKEQNFTI